MTCQDFTIIRNVNVICHPFVTLSLLWVTAPLAAAQAAINEGK